MQKDLSASSSDVKLLLEKYYSGLTTLEDENWLRRFFASQNVSPEFEADKNIFNSLNLTFDTDNQNEVNELVLEAIQLRGNANVVKRRKLNRTIAWYSIAASLVLAFTIGWFTFQHKTTKLQADSFSDPVAAMQFTRDVLEKVSQSLNKGNLAMKPMAMLGKSLDQLEPLDQIQSQVDRMKRPIQTLQDPLTSVYEKINHNENN